MFFRIKVDSLLIFLVFSLGLIAMSSDDLRSLVGLGSNDDYDHRLNIETSLRSPESLITNGVIRTQNPSHLLHYSTDGGDTYRSTPQLDVKDFENSNILFERTSYRWRPSHGNFPKLKSIRLRVVDDAKKYRSNDKILTYYEDYNSDLPIISLNISNAGLFSWNRGIMTMGRFESEQMTSQHEWWWKNANYQQRGVLWEREANIQYIEHDQLLLDQNCGIRISGNATRSFPQKSMRVYSRRTYGKEFFTFPFWEDGVSKTTSIVLRNSGNDNAKTLFADRLLHALSRDCKVLVQEGKAVNVFINGNYWGIYNLRERIDIQFIAEKRDCKIEEVTILEDGNADLKYGLEVEKENFDKIMAGLPDENDVTSEDIARLNEQISFGSFIDYIILETYFGNEDWPHNNSICYKTEDKKWRWLLNDLDYTMAYSGKSNLHSNIFEKLKDGGSYVARLYQTLISYEQFKERFKARAEEIFESILSKETINKTFSEIKSEYEPDILMAIDRWRVIDSIEDWKENCKMNLDYLLNRQQIYLDQIANL
ncbi:CotH kinase family protein [Crocinitomix catalasitica]|nr:CotH kinase family protein [Crocinitomix catalasitica]